MQVDIVSLAKERLHTHLPALTEQAQAPGTSPLSLT